MRLRMATPLKTILILNGPNLNLLGIREPEIYGTTGFLAYFEQLKERYSHLARLIYFQSNHEGELIDKLHELGFSVSGIVFNPGGYTHTSIALADAVAAIPVSIIEVHISNTHARESYRQQSYISAKAKGTITGLGLAGYDLAIQYFAAQP